MQVAQSLSKLGEKKNYIMYHLNSVQREPDVLNRSQNFASKYSSSLTGEKYTHLWENMKWKDVLVATIFFWHSAVCKVQFWNVLHIHTSVSRCPSKKGKDANKLRGSCSTDINTGRNVGMWSCALTNSANNEEKRECSPSQPAYGECMLSTSRHSPLHQKIRKELKSGILRFRPECFCLCTSALVYHSSWISFQ